VTLRHATAAVACALAVLGTHCASIAGDANAPLAIEFVLPTFTRPFIVDRFDTVLIGVRVRNNAGDTIPGAPVQVISFAPDTLAVDTLPLPLALVGLRTGPARVVAISGRLHSDPLVVSVVPGPDSLAPDSTGLTHTVATQDSVSTPLVVHLLDLKTDTTHTTGLTGYFVTFAVIAPTFASDSAATVLLSNNSRSDVVTTSAGVASVTVKRRSQRSQPDSVVVQASAIRSNGRAVHGSPIRFVVRFQ
jgi:hypothetical protein